MGLWTDHLGADRGNPIAYAPIFGVLGAMMVLAMFSTPIIARLSPRRVEIAMTAPILPSRP
jgi:hypothetical protein